MRLYINTKEVPYLKRALRATILGSASGIERELLGDLLERIELCERLQKNERRAMKEENNDD